MTAYINPPTAVTGNVITAVDINSGHTNHRHFNELVPTPTSWPLALICKAADDGDWDQVPTAAIADLAVTNPKIGVGAAVANIGYTPLNKAGDSVEAQLSAPSFRLNSGDSFWQWIASGPSVFIGIPAVANPLEMTQSGVLITGTLTRNGATVIDTSNDSTLCDAASVIGLVPTATPTAGAIPRADGSGKLDGWVTLSGGGASVPSGLVASFRTAAEIAAGWNRETNLDGRMMVGAGTTFTVTFTEGQDYGASWAHIHASCSYSASVTGSATGGAEDATAGPTGLNGLATAGGVNLPTTSHTHSLEGVSFAVSASGTATGDSSSTAWAIPSRAYVFARKS